MKATCTLVASVVAASTVGFTSSTSGDRDITFNPCASKGGKCVKLSGFEKEKYAPKLDHGLRFIETLVTAHRYVVLPTEVAKLFPKNRLLSEVKQFHPDVMRGAAGGGGPQNSDIMIRRLIQAYQIIVIPRIICISSIQGIMVIITSCGLICIAFRFFLNLKLNFRECVDPFDQPECEAFDVFVNEVLCIGKGHGEDYKVDVAVGQCPKSCIHYVTPLQRIILEELLHSSILNMPYDTSSEAELLYSLIVKAKYENNRYQVPKRGVDFKA
ncbi:hypothetical protein BUALT_Bualt02G0112700 [Buddleja alternifolia]|uniref:Uncharacterized protein n=1 Tax=Buddleja alternifolia TaxID=168488 RepID=A0AAV6Y0P1_9LAMI|nr:hypothetical protein BUALT_Bualt02G0112700 [Buddleja alternifolia]